MFSKEGARMSSNPFGLSMCTQCAELRSKCTLAPVPRMRATSSGVHTNADRSACTKSKLNPAGCVSTIGHKSHASYDAYISAMPSKSNVQSNFPFPSARKFVVIHCAPSTVNPAPVSDSTSDLRLSIGLSSVVQNRIVSLG